MKTGHGQRVWACVHDCLVLLNGFANLRVFTWLDGRDVFSEHFLRFTEALKRVLEAGDF
jgi:hypothetical protein